MPRVSKSAPHRGLTTEQALHVGDTLRAARVNADLTQEALAAASGLTVGQVSRLERGLSNPTLATLYALAAALGATVGQLVD